MMRWWLNDWEPMSWVLAPLMLIVLIVLIFFMVRWMMGAQRPYNRLALDILKGRGKISQAEDEERRRLIEVVPAEYTPMGNYAPIGVAVALLVILALIAFSWWAIPYLTW
jgi:hypothetical protein